MLHTTVISTPPGPLAIVLDDDGVVVASGFASVDDQLSRLPDSLRRDGVVADADRSSAATAVADYLAGDMGALDRVPVRQPGGAFQQGAWLAMRQIPPGQTWSYSELATKVGHPDASRAAGSACARNLVAPFVPCHRVVRSDGSLGGYYYGLSVKEWLLAHEGRADDQLVFDAR
jgi:methylated-DNA-[protein]-cysteine S-methyltransferase